MDGEVIEKGRERVGDARGGGCEVGREGNKGTYVLDRIAGRASSRPRPQQQYIAVCHQVGNRRP